MDNFGANRARSLHTGVRVTQISDQPVWDIWIFLKINIESLMSCHLLLNLLHESAEPRII